MKHKVLRAILLTACIVGLLATIGIGTAGFYFYFRLTRDLPRIEKLSDYRPKAVSSIYASDGTLIAEVWDERRYPVALEEIPLLIRQAFLAAEDANFYTHPGIDFVSIVRAMWVNMRSQATRQGASTITQQIVKELLLTREKTYERKLKEALLSYRLESALTKDEILSIYLNQIYLGSGSYGIRAASKIHFRKELAELSIAEAAFLAGLPQKPSELSKIENRQMALDRQKYVLGQMRRNNMITEDDFKKAYEEKLTIYQHDEENIYHVPYFATHVIRLLDDIFAKIDPDLSIRDPGGYSIQTTADVEADRLASRALKQGLRELDKRQGWRGPSGNIKTGGRLGPEWNEIKSFSDLHPNEVYQALVQKVEVAQKQASVKIGAIDATVDLKNSGWANRKAIYEPGATDIKTLAIDALKELRPGDIIEVSLPQSESDKKKDAEQEIEKPQENVRLRLDQSPVVEGAMVVQNALTGEVEVIIGGYDYRRSKFNRATQGSLQPGSSFKPFIYLAAVEHLGLTPVSIVPDSPVSFPSGDGTIWSPQNYDHTFLGPITLRTALQRSRNVVSVYLLNRLGVRRGVESARRLGITTPIPAEMSIALGTPEVRVIEMVRAYGAFAAEGWLADSLIINSIEDRDGKVIYKQKIKQQKVIDDADAFIMANMMKGVIERGTAQVLKELGRPVAGKTGTTNDQMDAWFIGFTPEWVAGIWVGFDQKRTLGRLETGGKAAAPIFLNFMKPFLEDVPLVDFNIPDGVIPSAISLESGLSVDPTAPGAFIEYFKSGTEPGRGSSNTPLAPPPAGGSEEGGDYLTNSDF